MPSIFKALATITVWVLFIFGLLAVVLVLVANIVTGGLFPGPPPWHLHAGLAGGILSLVLSVVVMRLRQKME